jgi:hypothetical protein
MVKSQADASKQGRDQLSCTSLVVHVGIRNLMCPVLTSTLSILLDFCTFVRVMVH